MARATAAASPPAAATFAATVSASSAGSCGQTTTAARARGRLERAQGRPAHGDRARGRLGLAPEAVEQRLRRRRIRDRDAVDAPRRDVEREPVQRPVAQAVDHESERRAAVPVDPGRAAGRSPHRGRRGEHLGQAVRRGPRAGEERADPRQAAERADEELRHADRRDQLADRDVARRGEPAADERDRRERDPADEHRARLERGLRAGGAERRVERGPARGAVARHARADAADALEHPQPVDEVGGHAGRVGRAGLLLGGAPAQRPGEPAREEQRGGQPDEDQQPELQRRQEQHDRAGAERHRDPGPERDGRHDARGGVDVGAGHGHELARQPAALAASARVEHPRHETHAQVVRRALRRRRLDAGADAERRREEHEEHAEEPEPEHERAGVGRLDRRVDRRADEHRHERLQALVGAEQPGRAGHAAAPGAQRPPQQCGAVHRPRRAAGTIIGAPVAGHGTTWHGSPKTASTSSASTISRGSPCATIAPSRMAIRCVA